jgi:hypothetical protein
MKAISAELANGADPDLMIADSSEIDGRMVSWKWPLLAYAIVHKQLDVASLLLEYNANPNATSYTYKSNVIPSGNENHIRHDTVEYSPLYLATQSLQTEMVDLLLKHHVSPYRFCRMSCEVRDEKNRVLSSDKPRNDVGMSASTLEIIKKITNVQAAGHLSSYINNLNKEKCEYPFTMFGHHFGVSKTERIEAAIQFSVVLSGGADPATLLSHKAPLTQCHDLSAIYKMYAALHPALRKQMREVDTSLTDLPQHDIVIDAPPPYMPHEDVKDIPPPYKLHEVNGDVDELAVVKLGRP